MDLSELEKLSVIKGYFVAYPLLISLVIFIIASSRKGFSIAALIAMGVSSSRVQLIKFALLGFSLESNTDLSEVITGGGIVSRARVASVVILSTTIAGIIVGTKTLASVERLLEKTASTSDLFLATTIVSLAAAVFGCTQTIAILMTEQLVHRKYERQKLDGSQLANDIENTAVVLSPLIPWNIAGLVPATILMTGSGFIPYAVYLYLLPLLNWIQIKLTKSKKSKLF